ncbi:hypothetical protein BDV40DRAFT_256234 [Aspergillus tamarii]|uniref:Uncharacterized protein n=1 Tax=Aspergillus tamarii TaxID=41984 RepID=A0A5N6V630_ASPTM|nr:hypothetical protein BDV40DRAFT_256234 [Aspergillus tamarii]
MIYLGHMVSTQSMYIHLCRIKIVEAKVCCRRNLSPRHFLHKTHRSINRVRFPEYTYLSAKIS